MVPLTQALIAPITSYKSAAASVKKLVPKASTAKAKGGAKAKAK